MAGGKQNREHKGTSLRKRPKLEVGYEGQREDESGEGSSSALPVNRKYSFAEVGLLPHPKDNVAIATRRLEKGSVITLEGGREVQLDSTVLEGHRFLVQDSKVGDFLMSWQIPFGKVTQDALSGSYVRNSKIIKALKQRSVGFEIPEDPNFDDYLEDFHLTQEEFVPAQQTPLLPEEERHYFEGFDRGVRGVGTRNYVVVVALASVSAGFATRVAKKFSGKSKGSLDGVVAVAHTEGVMQIVGPETGTPTVNVQMKEPRNKRMVVRTLAGFIVHPNVGAALIIDSQDPDVAVHASDVDEEIKRREEREGKSLLATSRYQVLTLSGDLHSDVSRASKVLEDWIPTLEGMNRTKQPLSKLTIALQCGGSDSFSGVSANPLMGAAARKLIQHGGSAILAETDELMGAEPYILRSTRDYATAQSFLKTIAWYKSWAAHHGHTAEANPSGGNNFRGLYNIALKSLGAAMKKPKDVSLDYVLDYGEAIGDRNGYFFMNSPGNDLESIAGQVASGSNIVYFSTGNGSITNFPFVPTLKVVTTTTRFRMLENEMDVNAGRYLDGETMESLSSNLFHQTITAASGTKTRGEAAKHYQVSIWRNWCQDVGDILEFDGSKTIGTPLVPEVPRVEISESPLHVKDFGRKTGDYCFTAWGKDSNGIARTGRIGLVLATSLCSSQASVTMAENLVSKWNLQVPPEVRDFFQSFTALAHTEGCGASSGASEDIFAKIITGHAASPLVSAVCCVEHGCEKTHNDYMIPLLKEKLNQDIPLGCASLQLDGGVQSVTDKLFDFFSQSAVANTKTDTEAVRRTCQCNLSNVRVGMTSNVGVAPNVAEALMETACAILEAGGTVVVPSTSPLLQSAPFRSDLIRSVVVTPTIGFAQVPTQPGLHVMDCPSSSFLEVITGLGACGTNAILTATPSPSSTHPLVPVFQMWSGSSAKWGRKCPPGAHDLVLEEASGADNAKLIISKLLHVLEGSYVPKAKEGGNVAFQITRGYEGISM